MYSEQEQKEHDIKMEVIHLKSNQPLLFTLGLVLGFLIGLLF